MRRAQSLGHLLLGYYKLPLDAQGSIEAVICPPGEGRFTKKIWNGGDMGLKFIVLDGNQSSP